MLRGRHNKFTATGTFSDSATQDLTTQVTWSSSDTGKATINGAGLATSVAAGTTTITATSGSISGNTTLTVTATATAATLASIAVTPAAPSILRSATRQFTATGTYTDSTTIDITSSVTWNSTTTSVATISTGGMVTPISAGTTIITAVSGSISGNTTLTVQGVNLPKTGQIVSYPTATSPDDGFYKRGVAWPSTRFTVGVGAEVDCVTDNLTGLMWVKAPDSTTRQWQAALDYADGLTLCGHTDWRLPNRKELRSLIDYSGYNPALQSGHPFTNVQADGYWSSTTYAGGTSGAWYVNMYYGYVYLDTKSLSYYVWPVRSGQ